MVASRSADEPKPASLCLRPAAIVTLEPLNGGEDAAGALLAAGATICLLAIGAGPVHSEPRITVTVSKGVSARPLQHQYDLHLPVLSGAKPKAKRTFGKIVSGITEQQLQFLLRWRNRVSSSPACRAQNSKFRTRTRTAIVDRRYATAAIIASTWPACGNVDQVNARTVNLDLRTGESLRLDTLIDRDATYPAVKNHLSLGARTVTGNHCDAEMHRRSSLYNWVLKAHGIQFWFDKYEVSSGYCGAVSVTVPWRELPLTPKGQRLADRVR